MYLCRGGEINWFSEEVGFFCDGGMGRSHFMREEGKKKKKKKVFSIPVTSRL